MGVTLVIKRFEAAVWLAHPDLQREFPNVSRGETLSTDRHWRYEDWLRIHYYPDAAERAKRDNAANGVNQQVVQGVMDAFASRSAYPYIVPDGLIVTAPGDHSDTFTCHGLGLKHAASTPDGRAMGRTLVFIPTFAQDPAVLEEVFTAVSNLEGDYDVLVVENSTNDDRWAKLRAGKWFECPGWVFVRLRFEGSSDKHFYENAVKQAKVYEWARHYALTHDYADMLIVEHDVIPPPSTIQRLRSHGLPIVLGTYRMPPDHHVVAGFFNGDVPYRPPPKTMYGITILPEKAVVARGLVRVHIGGLGCALLKRSLLEEFGFRAYADTMHHCDVYLAVDLLRKGVPLYLDSSVRAIHLRDHSLEDHWRKDGDRGERMYEPWQRPPDHVARYDWAAKLLASADLGEKRVLDVGCGSGYGTDRLRKAGLKALGLDVDWTPVLYAQRHYGPHFLNQDFFADPLGTDVFFTDPSSRFDALISFENIEHVDNGFAYIAQAWRLLRKDGLFIVSTPRKGTSGSPYHLREYDYAAFRALVETHFTVTAEAWQDDNEVHAGHNEQAKTFILTCKPKLEPTRPLASIFMGVKLKVEADRIYLQEAVKSALAQTYPWVEVVLVHNGPIPPLPDDPRLHVYAQTRQAGKGEKDMNVGAAEALARTTGDYVLRLDHDNHYYPNTVEDRVLWMLQHPDVALAYSDGRVINETGAHAGDFPAPDFNYDSLLANNYVDGNAVICKGNVWRDASFDLTAWVEDWDCWLRIALHHKVAKMPGSTFDYRRHPGNMTRLTSPEITESVQRTRDKIAALRALTP